MKFGLWIVGGIVIVLAIDCAIGHYVAWRNKRERAQQMARFGMSAFKGTKDRFLS
jgi:hypothetical protein